jgi:hypothetical protein
MMTRQKRNQKGKILFPDFCINLFFMMMQFLLMNVFQKLLASGVSCGSKYGCKIELPSCAAILYCDEKPSCTVLVRVLNIEY